MVLRGVFRLSLDRELDVKQSRGEGFEFGLGAGRETESHVQSRLRSEAKVSEFWAVVETDREMANPWCDGAGASPLVVLGWSLFF